MKRLLVWFRERWPLDAVLRLALEEEIPGGARYAYTLGSAVLTVFFLQAVTGVFQLLFYVPSTDLAYDSVSYIRTRVQFGWLFHGLHYWGAQAMIVLVLFHMTRVFLWGAYKKPRELTWLLGVTLLLTVMAFSFSGSPLHWDQRGYWIGEVSTSIAGTAPVAGDIMKRLIRGGEAMGQVALSRLFTMHVGVLPAVLFGLFGLHIIAMRRFGSVGPWDEAKRGRSGPFWPDQVYKDIVIGTAILFILITLAVFLPPGYSGPADPLDASYIPKPDWNFLFLYEALKYFQGRLEPVGTAGVPAVLIAILFLLPFIDRNPERNPLKRPFALAGALLLGGILAALSIKGYLSPGFGQVQEQQRQKAEISLPGKGAFVSVGEAAGGPSGPAGGGKTEGQPGPAAYMIGSAERGGMVFERLCSACHGKEGRGGVPNPGSTAGKVPSLTPIDRRLFSADARTFAGNLDIIIQHGSRPAGASPAISMPPFGDSNTLTQPEIANVEAYILALNSVDRGQIVNPGMEPGRFYVFVAAIYILVVLALGGLRKRMEGR